MAETYALEGSGRIDLPKGEPGTTIIVNQLPSKDGKWSRTLLKFGLGISILANMALAGLYLKYYPQVDSSEEFRDGDRMATDKVAVVKVSGMITSDSVAAPKRELKTAAKDAGVKAVVLQVNSPGGTIEGSDDLYKAVAEFKSKSGKPLIVAMQGMATSGAYYIAMPADEIYADRSCITGSIGVITQLFNFESFMKTHGLAAESIKSGPMKDSGSPFRSLTSDERKEWQKMIDSMYSQFLGVILKHRTSKVGGEEKLRTIADGRVYVASEAKSLGLIDEIGYLDDAIDAAKKRAGLGEKTRIVGYSRPMAITDLIGLSAPVDPRGLPAIDGRSLLDRLTPRMYLLPSWCLGI